MRGETFSDVEKILDEDRIPQHEDFYNILKKKSIMPNHYEIAKQNWIDLGCNNMRDFVLQYMKTDVLLLGDIFENFRDMLLEYYQIDHFYCYSSPGFAFQAGMKYTKVELKYFDKDSYDKLLFYEHGTRGGMTGVFGDRHIILHNKYVDESFARGIKLKEEEFNKLLEEFENCEDKTKLDWSKYVKINLLLYLDEKSLCNFNAL